MPKITAQPGCDKPKKPYKDFPLFPHATKRWAKKIRGKTHYFGPWADPAGAIEKYQQQRDDLYAGRTPRTQTSGPDIRDLVNSFLTTKKHLADSGELTSKTFADYYRTCQTVLNAFGRSRLVADLTPTDFESLRSSLGKTRGPVGLSNEIQRVRVLFKYAFDQELIEKPVRFGQGFKKPEKRILRQARIDAGERMFEAKEIRQILDIASPVMKAMVLLGINCGFGNTDVANLPTTAVDLKSKWVSFPRTKTAIHRRAHLWPKTVAAIKAAMALRPAPLTDEDNGLVFITKYGRRWVRFRMTERQAAGPDSHEAWIDSVGLEFNKLLRSLKIKRRGVSFYALRHTFETIGGESKDQVAVDHIMGHAREDMASRYRERINDERLIAVTEHVRRWLFPKAR